MAGGLLFAPLGTHNHVPVLTCRSNDESAGAYRWRVAVRAVQVGIQ